ncbi:hypothetical protein DRQ09_09095 [candidate division KSB1 bacterium]|nr:MAG: hypothetical protein DRQ09_09095 [candidate division KSB1 bacterium]
MKLNIKFLKNSSGFTLIELVVVIVILGILSLVTIRSITSTSERAKFEATVQEMDVIAKAVVGDPSLMENGVRTDFGYVGDVGQWPSSLNDLVQDPGVGNWRGPYLKIDFNENSQDYLYDAWNNAYTFPNAYTIQSSGGGSGTITKKVVNSLNDALNNSIIGNLTDWNGSSPLDSDLSSFTVTVKLQSGLPDLTATISSGGLYEVTGVHIGNHTVIGVYDPPSAEPMTVSKYVSVNPGSVTRADIRFSTTFEGTGAGGSGPGGSPQADLLTITGDPTIGNRVANGLRLGNTSDSQTIQIDQLTVDWTNAQGNERYNQILINGDSKWFSLFNPQRAGTTQTLSNATISPGATDWVLEIRWSSFYQNPQGKSLILTFWMSDGSSKSFP